MSLTSDHHYTCVNYMMSFISCDAAWVSFSAGI